jgi:hypothetical protein
MSSLSRTPAAIERKRAYYLLRHQFVNEGAKRRAAIASR